MNNLNHREKFLSDNQLQENANSLSPLAELHMTFDH